MMNLLVQLRTRVKTLQLCMQATHNVGFPMENLFPIEEPFQALLAHL